MASTPRIEELLEDLLASSRTPEEACRDCPELLPQLRQRWQRLCACDAYLDALFPAPGFTAPAGPPSPVQLAADLPQIPGYEVQEMLGHGGMGVVYKARHLRLNRVVALKMLLAGASASPEYRQRFLREAEAVAGLRHPNIVQVHDLGDLNNQPYFTMEFVEGGTLAEQLVGTPQTARQAAALLATLAEAVQAAHQSGIVHRDLKPANVLMTADGTPKISDFGLARRLEGEAGLTLVGAAVGTPSYMAPEQAEARPHAVGPAIDVYALGAILYELLTGRPPFQAETAAETVRQVISQEPAPPSRLNAKVPCDLETICLTCLHKEPRFRYRSAAALAADLHRFLNGEAIAARLDGPLARLARRVRRRPVHSAMISVGALLAVSLLGGGTWLVYDRAALARAVDAERVATDRAAQADLREMAHWLKQSAWSEAHAALERARGRLGDRDFVEPRRLLDQGIRDLELVARLEAIHVDVARGILGFDFTRSEERYEQAFRESGIGQFQDNPEIVAARVRASNVQNALMAALDDWSGVTKDTRRRNWVLAVARQADPDPTAWRDRARNPDVLADNTALVALIETAPVADPSVPLFLALDKRVNRDSKVRLPFLKQIQRAHPNDFWINQTLGELFLLGNKPELAMIYYHAAASIRPRTALSHQCLGYTFLTAGQMEESLRHLRLAVDVEPTCYSSRQLLAFALSDLGRYDEAIHQLETAIRFNSNSAGLRTALGRRLEATGRTAEALAQHQQAVALDPNNTDSRRELQNVLARLGRGDEARMAWKTVLEARPASPADWAGYAEFCLFLGQNDEYRHARQRLLTAVGDTTDPIVAAKTATACLLMPATEEELRQSVALAERALAVGRVKEPGTYPYFSFAQGLAKYREGRFDQAISTMRGEASRVPGPAPNLVLALAQHKSGQIVEARKTLAAAILTHDWMSIRVSDENDWLLHVLRREAECLILPRLPDFLAGKHQPQDNDERFALLGACLFTDRTFAMARLYADAFAATPRAAIEVGPLHRYNAARSAAAVGTGHSVDGENLSQEERARWRRQAHDWLAAELSAWANKLDAGITADRHLAWRTFTYWRAAPEMAGVRERSALEKLSDAERRDWLTLWATVDALLQRAASP